MPCHLYQYCLGRLVSDLSLCLLVQREEKGKRRRIIQRTLYETHHFLLHVYCFSAMFYYQKDFLWYICPLQQSQSVYVKYHCSPLQLSTNFLIANAVAGCPEKGKQVIPVTKYLQYWARGGSDSVCELWYPYRHGFRRVWRILNHSLQRFMQHFDLLQKAQIPECITYYSFKEAAAQAHMAVRTQPWKPPFTSLFLCLFEPNREIFFTGCNEIQLFQGNPEDNSLLER